MEKEISVVIGRSKLDDNITNIFMSVVIGIVSSIPNFFRLRNKNHNTYAYEHNIGIRVTK
jgi:hypothetical protein